MATNASPSARLAPTRLQMFARYLVLATLPAALILAFTYARESKAPSERRITLYCALAFPPSQVAPRAELELVYCKRLDVERQCQADFGWIVLSEPVPCD